MRFRVFVALDVPDAIRHQVGQLVQELRARVPSRAIRWVRPENVHLTLRFIGNVDPAELPALTSALRSATAPFPPFNLQLGEAGSFPEERAPRVIWIGLDGELECLRNLQSAVVQGSSAWGAVENRSFHPHLTLGRVVTRRQDELCRLGAVTRQIRVPSICPWRVASVQLIQSELAPGGSRYTALACLPLPGTIA